MNIIEVYPLSMSVYSLKVVFIVTFVKVQELIFIITLICKN